MIAALRGLFRRPGFAVSVIAVLAVATSASTALLSMVEAALLRPVPWKDPARLVTVWEHDLHTGTRLLVSPANWLDWKDAQRSFSATALWRFVYADLQGAGSPERIQALAVSDRWFDVLGVRARPGRTAPGRGEVVLTDALWKRRYGGDESIVGRSIVVDGAPATVAGVLPADFWFFPVLDRPIELFLPIPLDRAQLPRDERTAFVYARLKGGVSRAQAQSELDSLYQGLGTDIGARVVPMSEAFAEQARKPLLLLLGAVGLLVVIACANVANLLLVRGAAREREIAVRLALGATRCRLARDLVLESMLLGLAGGIAGAILALPVLSVVEAHVPWSALRAIGELRLDPEVLALAFGASLLAGIAFGVVPALRLPDARALREGARSSAAPSRLRDGLVVAEIALAASLLATSGPVLRGAQHLLHASRGFDSSSVLTAQLWIPPERRPEPRQVVDLVRSAVDKIEAIPGVERASAVNFPPGSTSALVVPFVIAGTQPAGEEPRAVLWVVLPGYFETLRIPLLAGRSFDGTEPAGAAIVSASLARTAWPGLDPIGRTLEPRLLKTRAFWAPESAPQTLTVVGIAADVREEGLSLAGLPQIYLPLSQSPARLMHLLVRARGEARAVAREVSRAVAEIDPAQPVFDVKSLDDVLAASFTQPRFAAALLSAFAGLALLLSAIGTYAVMALSVAQRRREMGIRIALGAGTRSVAALVVGKGIRLTLLGLVLGLPGGYALTRSLASFVEGIEAFDVEIYLGIVAVLGLAALLACALPAIRAARVPPAIALQAE